MTPANEQERAQVAELAAKVREISGGTVEIAFVDQGFTGPNAAEDAQREGIKLEVVRDGVWNENGKGSLARSTGLNHAGRLYSEAKTPLQHAWRYWGGSNHYWV